MFTNNGEDNDNVTWQSNRCPRIEDHSDILHQGDTDRAHCSCARNLSCRHVIPHIVQVQRCHHVICNFAQRTILSPLPPERSFATRPNWRRDGPSLKRLTYQIPSLEEKLCLKLLFCFWKINLDGKAPQASLDGEDTGSVGRNSPAISFPISWSAFGKGSAIALVGASEVFDPVVAGHCWHSLGNWQLRLDKWRPEESWRRDRTDRSGAKKRDETMRSEKKRLDDEKWRQKSDCCQSQESL